MLILPEYNKPFLIESLTSPLIIKHNWIFNGSYVDFMLSPITYLEETTGAAIKIRVNGTEFWVPATWQILVTDQETYQLDTVSIQSCVSSSHVAFSFSPDEMRLRTLSVEAIDYVESMSLVHPMINKGTSLVHPVGPVTTNNKTIQLAIAIGPHDLYKFLADKVVGDIFTY